MPLHVIGLGVAEQAQLDASALAALQQATLVIGSNRQLATVSHYVGDTPQQLLPKLSELSGLLAPGLEEDDIHIALLASGDPLYFGIGKWVAERFPHKLESMVHFYPAISSIQMACHRMAWSLQDVSVLSLHGRPVDKLKTRLVAGRRLVILTDNFSSPEAIAAICVENGFGESLITVYETLGYPEETCQSFSASDLIEAKTAFHPLNICCVEVKGSALYLPRFPGIEDQLFVTDKANGKGMLTKREVRLMILSLLQPTAGDILWDIGAGCGGVAVELAYWAQEANIYAIEHHPERLACLEANQARFGVISNLHIMPARAPDGLKNLPSPNKVFIGGSDGELDALLATIWERLPNNGILVVSAVTEATKNHLYRFYQCRLQSSDSVQHSCDIAVSRGETLAGELLHRPNLPVRLFAFTKTVKESEIK